MPKIGEIKKGKQIDKTNPSSDYVWAKCPNCGKERWVIKHYFAIKQQIPGLCWSCSRINPVNGHGYAWKGGSYNRPDGYINMRLEQNDFFYPMCDIHGFVLQHRLIIAKYFNRCLLPWEVVHHKNGIKDDNRLENLELLPTGKYHLIDTAIKKYIKELENKVKQLEAKLASNSGLNL